MSSFIPRDRYINRDDLLRITPQQLQRARDYFVQEFGYYTHCFRTVISQLEELFLTVEDGGVVLAPGDSPSKLIQVMKIVYGKGDQYTMPIGDQLLTKNIRIVEFPLSRARNLRVRQIDPYLRSVLAQQNVPLASNFYMFDISRGGETHQTIERSLGRLKNIRDYRLPLIAIDLARQKAKESPLLSQVYHLAQRDPSSVEMGEFQHIYRSELEPCIDFEILLDTSEETNSRCVPYYQVDLPINEPVSESSLMRCNLIILVLADYAIATFGLSRH